MPDATPPAGGFAGQGQPGDEDYIQPGGTVSLFGMEIPQGGFSSVGGWSAANLLLALLALAGAVAQAVRMLRARRYADLEHPEARSLPRRLWPLVVLATGVVPMVLFLTLERFGQMILFSRWTPLCLALVVVHLASHIIAVLAARGKARG